jgi:glycosyltransferase involved in cell wall biosynthesis
MRKITIGSYTLVKNEALWVREHLRSWLPILDSMAFYDGGSTDGTLEIIKDHKARHELGYKIRLAENKDPINLQDDYTRLSNECMHSLDTDMAIFLHPDMMYESGAFELPEGCIAATMNLKSFAGNPGGDIYELIGRGTRWKNIYRLRNPDLGAHYYGHYGAYNEDTYFSEITGDSHDFHDRYFDRYPYPVFHSPIVVRHYSDVRPYERRLDRMVKCLLNQGLKDNVNEKAKQHPRVSLVSGGGFTFNKVDTPEFLV